MHAFTSCECVDNFSVANYNIVVNTSLIKVCSFFGHRQIEKTEELQLKIKVVVENLVIKGCKTFYFGGFGEFDLTCYEIVSKLKQQYVDIKRVFCVTEEKHLNSQKRPKWLKDKDYDEYIYLHLQYDYWYTKIYYRNCEIVNNSDYVVFYAKEDENSGAYKILKYAKKIKKQYINLIETKTADT